MKKKISIIIINGKPRSGKDTTINYIRQYCVNNECAIYRAYSTIDPVKNALMSLGWNGEKSDDIRNLLASLKQFWINNNDGPLKYCMDIIMKDIISVSTDDVVLIFQIREPDEIAKLVNALNPIKSAYGLDVSTVFVDRSFEEEKAYGNSADTDVACYKYDAGIMNNGTLEELRSAVYKYMDDLLGLGGEE